MHVRALDECLLAERPSSIDAVIAQMEAIGSVLDPADGVARFNDLYLETTRGVRHALVNGVFKNAAFLEALDVEFACLYFAALRGSLGIPQTIPHAWRPLFACRENRAIMPLQFALAGMNAHINRDLPVALVKTSAAFKVDLGYGTAEHADYVAINEILQLTQEAVKRRLVTGRLENVDEALGQVDDEIALWSLCRARDAAWVNGQLLEHLQATDTLATAFLGTLDRMVGFAGRGLLFSVSAR
jgi:hypothetical protein